MNEKMNIWCFLKFSILAILGLLFGYPYMRLVIILQLNNLIYHWEKLNIKGEITYSATIIKNN